MKSVNLKYDAKLDHLKIKEVAKYFDRNGTFEYIDMLNWPTQFSYKPQCKFKIARSQNSLFIHFIVVEKSIKALFRKDQDPVWEDSCVEFFCKHPEKNTYFNFEFNCIGTCRASERTSKNADIRQLSSTEMMQINRFATLGDTTFDEQQGSYEWKLTVEIPFTIIGLVGSRVPELLLANFYKCGDATAMPHYLSWSYIATEQPDFHQPEYFGKVYF